MNSDDRDVYRSIIDSLVESCLHGQGQIARRKVSDGVWHRHDDQLVTPDTPDWMRASAEQNQR